MAVKSKNSFLISYITLDPPFFINPGSAPAYIHTYIFYGRFSLNDCISMLIVKSEPHVLCCSNLPRTHGASCFSRPCLGNFIYLPNYTMWNINGMVQFLNTNNKLNVYVDRNIAFDILFTQKVTLTENCNN